MLTVTPLLGAQSASSRASQTILEFYGGIKILVDVGWDDSFDIKDLTELEKHIPTLSLILLTHATSSHIGAFVHCCKSFPLFTQIPVYATSPVISLGRTLLQDLYASAPLAATFLPTTSVVEPGASSLPASVGVSVDATRINGNGLGTTSSGILLPPPTTEEIARYFSLIHPLKYSQPHQPLPSPFSPPLNGLTLTAYSAGHTVGGTIWHIQHGMESIVYAVDWNQTRENVAGGAAWFGGSGTSGTEVIEALRKPTALICSSKGSDRFAPAGGRQKRDALLLEMIQSSVSKGGSVLIPTDTSARVLELAYVLEHSWRDDADTFSETDNPLKSADIYLVGKKANSTMRLARSMLEWMDENIVREFEAAEGGDAASRLHTRTESQTKNAASTQKTTKAGPFTLKHLKIVERRKKFEKILTDGKPKVILAADSSLNWGYSKETLRHISSGPQNLILLTESFPHRYVAEVQKEYEQMTLGQMIWKWYEERRDGVAMETASDGELLEQVHSGGREMKVIDVDRTPLDPNEQLLYQQYLATKRQIQNTAQARGETRLDPSADALDDGSSSSSSDGDSDSEQQGRALNFSTSLAHSNRSKLGLRDEEIGVNVLLRRKNVYDYDVRGKKGRERMFPYVAPRRRGDEYGELIRPEEYLRAEEREEVNANQLKAESQNEMKVGQKRRWDETGPHGRRATIDFTKRQAVSRDGVSAVDLPMQDGRLVDEQDEVSSADESDDLIIQGPARPMFVVSSITVNARIAYVDFMGIHDKRSLEMLIPLIQPRKLILIGGMKEETMALAEECRSLLASKDAMDSSYASSAANVFTPICGETVDASVDTNAWVVKLSNVLVHRLKWQHVRNLGVVALTAQLRGPDVSTNEIEETEESATKKPKLLRDEADNVSTPHDPSTPAAGGLRSPNPELTLPVLDVLPANLAAGTRSVARPLHVGDLRLADLRKLMQSSGHTAEFRGEGTLLIDGSVAVRKSGTGTIEVEAAAQSTSRGAAPASSSRYMRGSSTSLTEGSFLAVKRKIYEGLAVVAGG